MFGTEKKRMMRTRQPRLRESLHPFLPFKFYSLVTSCQRSYMLVFISNRVRVFFAHIVRVVSVAHFVNRYRAT